MGSTNKTTNYELSQFVGLDKPSWLSDYNGDMAKIDTAIKARSVEAGAAQTTADTANGKADALDTRMGTAENNITALQNASTADHTQIATNTANISQNAQDIVQLDAKIGHTQITIGDHTVTGAIATLAGQGGVEADNVAYDNTTSGLTADDVQGAIDELAARPTVADASDVTFDNTGTTLQATNVEDAIKEVASSPASNVRWNATTDRFEVLKNGSWVQSVRAFVNSLAVWANGVFGITEVNGLRKGRATQTLEGGFTINNNLIECTHPTYGSSNDPHVRTLTFEGVDLTNYSLCKITTSDSVVHTINVSGLTGMAYLWFQTYNNGIGVSTSAQFNTSNTDGWADRQEGISSTELVLGTAQLSPQITITEITIE